LAGGDYLHRLGRVSLDSVKAGKRVPDGLTPASWRITRSTPRTIISSRVSCPAGSQGVQWGQGGKAEQADDHGWGGESMRDEAEGGRQDSNPVMLPCRRAASAYGARSGLPSASG
jgi:hypothetical protein